MDRIIEAMNTRSPQAIILSVLLYGVDVVGAVLSTLWIAGATEFISFYILIITAISITFTLVMKYNQYQDKKEEREDREEDRESNE